MNRFVPLLLAALLIPAYALVATSLPMTVKKQCDTGKTKAGVTDKVGFCSKIGFDVSRSYYFGLLRLPVYRIGINLDLLHRTVPSALLLIGAAGTLWMRRQEQDSDEQESSGYSYQTTN